MPDEDYYNEDAPKSLTLRAYNKLTLRQRCECTDCGWRGKVEDLDYPHELSQRIEEGEPMWAGDCPRCLALVNSDYQLQKWEEEAQAEVRLKEVNADLIAALKDLTTEIDLRKLNVHENFSLLVVHNEAIKAIDRAKEIK